MEKHPEKPWDWWGISCNPNITMEYIDKHPEKSWNYYNVSRGLYVNVYNEIIRDIIKIRYS